MISKKILAIMVIPMLLVLGGSVAFSAWSGSANSSFTEITATASYSSTLSFVHTNAYRTPLSITGSTTVSPVTNQTAEYTIETTSGVQSNHLTDSVHVTVSNLVPGDYAMFEVAITNTGTATLNTSTIIMQGNTSTRTLQAVSLSSSQDMAPLTSAQLSQLLNGTYPGIPITLCIAAQALTNQSSPNYLAPGASYIYTVYIIIPVDAPFWQMGYTYTLTVDLPISTAQ